MRLYKAIFDNGMRAVRIIAAAESEQAFKDIYGNNGDLVILKDVTQEFPIDVEKLKSSIADKFTEKEVNAIIRTVLEHYPTDIFTKPAAEDIPQEDAPESATPEGEEITQEGTEEIANDNP